MPSISAAPRRLLLSLFLVLLGLALVAPAALRAEDDEPEDPPAVAEPAPPEDPAPEPAPPEEPGDPAEGAPTDDESEDADKPTLHKVYVPYRELRDIFEKEGEGVFLPYEEFLALWKKAYGQDETTDDPPVKATVRTAVYEGLAEADTLRIAAALEVDVLAAGWQRIPLDFAGAGIESALVDGEPALLVPSGTGYDLLLDSTGPRKLDLVLRVPVARDGDDRTAEFALPPVSLARLTLTVPGTTTEIDVTPRLASTTHPTEDGGTKLLAFLGPVSHVKLAWRQRGEEGPTVQPLVFADETHSVRIDRGVLRSDLVASLSVLRAPLERLEVVVPSDAVILYVQGDGIRTWERSADGASLQVTLREPVRERWELRVGLERPQPDLPAVVPLPLAFVEGVERETGFLRLLAAEGVKVEPRDTPGLLQLDLQELPKSLQGAPAGRAVAYRFPARPGAATASVEALEPRVSTRLGSRIAIRPEGTDVRAVAIVTVERAGIFGVAFDLPPSLEVTAVRAVSGVEKDDHTIREVDGKRVLHVDFRDRLLGIARIEIDGRLETPLADEDEDGAEEQEVEFDLPLLVLRDAAHVKGYVAVHVDGSLEQREASRVGLVALDAGAAAAIEPPVIPGNLPLVRRLEHHEDNVRLVLALRRKDPVVTAQVETVALLELGGLRIETVLRYTVRHRGVDTLRFSAPLDLEGRLHLDLEGVELRGPVPIEPPTESGQSATRGVWTIDLHAPRTGALPFVLQVDEEEEDDAMRTGKPRPFAIPSFVPLETADKPLPNTVTHVGVRRDPLLEVAADVLTRVEEIDLLELPPAVQSAENFLAYRSYDPTWALGLVVTRHDYELVAEVVVSHLHLDTMLGRQGRATTEAYLKILNNDRQYLEIRLPAGANIRNLTVAGQSQTPRKGESDDTIRVPLKTGLGKGEAFIVAVAYNHDVERSAFVEEAIRVASPVPLDVTADHLTWRLFVPEDRIYTSFGGTVRPADPYRSWVKGLVDTLSTTLGGQPPEGPAIDLAKLVVGYESPFATSHEGREFWFHNRVGTGTVEISSADSTGFTLWKLLWFVVLFVVARALARIGTALRIGQAVPFVLLVALLLLLLVSAGPGSAQVLNAMLCGVLVSGCMSLVGRSMVMHREAAALRAEAAADSEEDAVDEGTDDGEEPTPAPEGGAA